MSYANIVAGLHTRFLTVPGLASTLILEQAPTSLADVPALWSVLESFERGQAGQLTTMTYITQHHLCLRWQNNAKAETQLNSFVNAFGIAVDADPQLTGTGGINTDLGGIARVISGVADWITIGGTEYRRLLVRTRTIEKGQYGGTLV